MALRLLSGAFIGGIAIFTAIMVVIAPETIVPPAWMIAVLLGLVAVAALVSFVMVGSVRPAGGEESTAQLMGRVQPVHMMRLAMMEAPAILAVVLTFVGSEPSWITVAIAAVPTILLMALLVFPHEPVLRRYERALDAGGARTQFTDRLLGRVS